MDEMGSRFADFIGLKNTDEIPSIFILDTANQKKFKLMENVTELKINDLDNFI